MPDIDSSTVAHFEARSRDRIPLEALRDYFSGLLAPSVTLVAHDFDRDLPRDNPNVFWRAFHERFPGTLGWATLSAVGYGESDRQALVYVEHHCGPRCGAGYLVLLSSGEGGWVVHAVAVPWVS